MDYASDSRKFWQLFSFKGVVKNLIFLSLMLLGLYGTSLISYLLFHSIVEIIGVVVGFASFVIVWNARHRMKNHSLLFMGIAMLFVMALDTLHLLAYRGMGVFPGYGANLATQLWIVSRYMQSLTLLAMPLFSQRKVNVWLVMFLGAVVTVVAVLSIFVWGTFPVCFVEGQGLTPFKIYSEYIISFIFLAASCHIYYNRRHYPRKVGVLLVATPLAFVASEMAFTTYLDVYDFSIMLGHIFMLVAQYLLYKALVETGVVAPLELLFWDLKQSEQRYRSLEARFRAIFDHAGVGIGVTNIDGRWVQVNREMEEMLGYTNEELLNLTIFDVTHPDDRGETRRLIDKVLSGSQKGYEVEKSFLHKNGERVWVHRAVTALNDEQGPVGLIGVAQNITSRKKMEASLFEAQKLAHLGTLAAGVAHELNSPLQVVVGVNDGLVRSVRQNAAFEPGELLRKLEMVQRNAWRCAEIIRLLNTYAYPGMAQYAPHDLNAIVREVVEDFSAKLSAGDEVRVETQLEPLPHLLNCDGNSVRQALNHLLANARDAVKEVGGGLITLSSAYDQERNAYLVSVSDTGEGVPEEICDKIFDPFFTTKEVGKGVGLGLALVRAVVRIHHGEVTLHNRPGQGTTFTLHFPAQADLSEVSFQSEGVGRYEVTL